MKVSRTVKAARLLTRFERLAKLLAADEVPADHVRVLSRYAIPARIELVERDVDLLCDLAVELCVDDYARAVARWADIADDVLGRGEPEDQFRRRGVTIRYHHHNGELTPRGPKAVIAEIEHHLDAHARPDPKGCPGGPRSRAQRRFDALHDLVRRGAGSGGNGRRSTPDRAFTILCAEDRFEGRFDPHGRCETNNGVAVSHRTAQRFACDSTLRGLLLDADGEVLFYGRRRRLFSPAQRAAIMARDGTCTVRGCDVPADRCDAHHVRGFDSGGPTDITNGTARCGYHHALVHEYRWTEIRHDDGSYTILPPRRRRRS